ncbi:VOC family protein [Ekhidna sp.]|jgi:predicted enzyme related to lactoylglutathione lyase|uniref:VOC family protein n=1 Tax=Ekhidna sp. TaxID=2608089 RepID=UPI0032EB39FB
MNNNILGLRTTIYMVPDIEKAKSWYTKAFDTDPYFDEPFYVGYNIGGYELGLQPEKEGQKRADNIESYWGVKDIRKEHKRFIKLGATKHTEVKEVGGGIEVTTLLDPWKNVIGLIYNPHFKLQ